MLRCSHGNTSNLSQKYLVNVGYKLDTSSLNFPITLRRLKTKKMINVPTSILCWADLFYSRSNCVVRMMQLGHPTHTHQFWRDFFIYKIQNQLDSICFSINSNSSRDLLAFKLFRLINSALLSNGMKCFSFLKTGLKKYFQLWRWQKHSLMFTRSQNGPHSCFTKPILLDATTDIQKHALTYKDVDQSLTYQEKYTTWLSLRWNTRGLVPTWLGRYHTKLWKGPACRIVSLQTLQ